MAFATNLGVISEVGRKWQEVKKKKEGEQMRNVKNFKFN